MASRWPCWHAPPGASCTRRRENRFSTRAARRALPQVTTPLLVVQAEHDDVTGPRNAQFIMDRVASSRRELVLLKQSYHLVSADLERSVVAERLQKFCASLQGQRANVQIAA